MWAGYKCVCWSVCGEGGTTLLACGHVHQPGYLWAVIKGFYEGIINYTASLVARMVKSLLAMRETWVRSQHQEDPLEKGMATHFSIPAWRIPWTEEPWGLQSVGSQRVGHNWAINTHTHTHTHTQTQSIIPWEHNQFLIQSPAPPLAPRSWGEGGSWVGSSRLLIKGLVFLVTSPILKLSRATLLEQAMLPSPRIF